MWLVGEEKGEEEEREEEEGWRHRADEKNEDRQGGLTGAAGKQFGWWVSTGARWFP